MHPRSQALCRAGGAATLHGVDTSKATQCMRASHGERAETCPALQTSRAGVGGRVWADKSFLASQAAAGTCFSCERRLASRTMCSLSAFQSLASNRTSSRAAQAALVAVASSPSRCCFSRFSRPSSASARLPFPACA